MRRAIDSAQGRASYSRCIATVAPAFASDYHPKRTHRKTWRSCRDHGLPASTWPTTAGIRDAFRHLANVLARTQGIAAEAAAAFAQGRKALVLTERTDHLDAIRQALTAQAPPPFVLHGRMSKTQRAALIAELDVLPSEAPRILVATGKLVGKGLDHRPLDTLVLAMPVSWKGTLQQCAGRLHREHAS